MSSDLPYKQSSNVERRTWDKESYEARAKARIDAATNDSVSSSRTTAAVGTKHPLVDEVKEEFRPATKGSAGPAKSQRAFLKSRHGKVDLDSKVGTSEIINPEAVAGIKEVSITDGVTKQGVGWHCKVCDCFLKDSLTYLDHINGRKHQRFLGYSMRVEKSTTSQISSKLSELAKEMQQRQTDITSNLYKTEKDKEDTNEFEEMVRMKDEEASRRKAERARKREERKKKYNEPEDESLVDPGIAAMMGFSEFGGK